MKKYNVYIQMDFSGIIENAMGETDAYLQALEKIKSGDFMVEFTDIEEITDGD